MLVQSSNSSREHSNWHFTQGIVSGSRRMGSSVESVDNGISESDPPVEPPALPGHQHGIIERAAQQCCGLTGGHRRYCQVVRFPTGRLEVADLAGIPTLWLLRPPRRRLCSSLIQSSRRGPRQSPPMSHQYRSGTNVGVALTSTSPKDDGALPCSPSYFFLGQRLFALRVDVRE